MQVLSGCLGGLSSGEFDRLYERPWSCKAILRFLPSAAQMILVRLLPMAQEVKLDFVYTWVPNNETHAIAQTVKQLCDLYLVKIVSDQFDVKRISINAVFRGHIISALLEQDEAFSQESIAEMEEVQNVSNHANKWFSILKYMVDPPSSRSARISALAVSKDVKDVLDEIGYISRPKGPPLINATGRADIGSEIEVTDKGYRFLLKPLSFQIWDFVEAYLNHSVERKDVTRVGVLNFLFRLSFLPFGSGYDLAKLDEEQQTVAKQLSHFGLVYISSDPPVTVSVHPFSENKSSILRFYPTPLAQFITTDQINRVDIGNQNSSIVVETNFRVYCYSSSAVQRAVLKLFVEIQYVLANLIVGQITAESVRSAFDRKIRGNDIIDFLLYNAHPSTQSRRDVVPCNVIDQIHLWETESCRLKTTRVICYRNLNYGVFVKLKDEFEKLGILVYASRTPTPGVKSATSPVLVVSIEDREMAERLIPARGR